MNSVTFTVPGTPIAKGRAKFARRGAFVTAYTPEHTAKYENLVKLAAAAAMAGTAPFTRPLSLLLQVYMPIPASWSKKRRDLAERGIIGATNKPDLSNILKALEDGMNGIVFTDDKLIVSGTFSKQYSSVPRVEVRVQEYLERETA